MLPLAAVECPAGHACMTLSVVADAPKVVVRSIAKEDVGAQIDRLRCALEASAEAGKKREVHGGVDGDEHVGVLRHWLVGRQRAEQGDPQHTRQRSCLSHEGEHGPEQMASWVGNRGPRSELPSLRILFHTSSAC